MPQPLADEPRDLKLDPLTNDLVIGSDLEWIRGIDAVVQSCRIALRMFQGEWFLNLDAGIPYWDQILGQKPAISIAIARDEFRRELLTVNGVLEVIRMDVTFDGSTRTLSVSWQARTALGETPIDTLTLNTVGVS